MRNIQKFIKKIPLKIYILSTIILVGIFLRVYHFHDWLRFSMDQSRDAFIISNAIEKKEALPLLGPIAGGTIFHLGPAYYYLSFISAKIFGNYPDKMAYPSLIFSILSIPLAFVFFKEYFSAKVSLILIMVMSFSYFFVINSRFSSNPNLIPFFVLLFLYSFLKIFNLKSNESIRWAILVGLSLGIGIQLHTTLLAIMPLFSVIAFIYLIKKNKLSYLRHLLIVISFSLILNLPQIISEIKTGGENATIFYLTLNKKNTEEEKSLTRNFLATLTCQAKANPYMAFSLPVEKDCSKEINWDIQSGSKDIYGEIKDRPLRRKVYIFNLSFLSMFFLTGYFLFARRLFQENNPKKKSFLVTAGTFNFLSLLVLTPIASSINTNYFNIIFFVPLIFLGFIIEYFQEKFKRYSHLALVIAAILLSVILLKKDLEMADYYEKGLDNNLENSNLKWAEDVAVFFTQNKPDAKTIYLSGEKKYLERFAGPISYATSQKGIELVEIDASLIEKTVPEGEEFFYIKNFEEKETENRIRECQSEKNAKFNPIDVYVLKKL